jgi:hypothetical protein
MIVIRTPAAAQDGAGEKAANEGQREEAVQDERAHRILRVAAMADRSALRRP